MKDQRQASIDVLKKLLFELGLPSDDLTSLGQSKSDVFVVGDSGLVAKVSTVCAECLEREYANIKSLEPLTDRCVRLARGVPPLHVIEKRRILLTQRLMSTGPIDMRELPNELNQFLNDISTLSAPIPSWLDQHKTTCAQLRHVEPLKRSYLETVFERHLADLVSREWDLMPIHGDAYEANAIQTKTGVTWLDMEDIVRAPKPLAFALLDAVNISDVNQADLERFKTYRAWVIAVWESSIVPASKVNPRSETATANLQRMLSCTCCS